MLLKANFPVNERVASGTSYKEMLAEFGVIGAFIAFYLIFEQLGWSGAKQIIKKVCLGRKIKRV